MFSFLFQCIVCHLPISYGGLCAGCDKSLVSAPPLCPRCAGFSCSSRCRKPWISSQEVDSFSARYLCIEPGYRVLKRWKVNQGALALDRRILSNTPFLKE